MTSTATPSTDVQPIRLAEVEARALTLFLPTLIASIGVPVDVLEEMSRACSDMQARHVPDDADDRARQLERMSADLAGKLLQEAAEARRTFVLAATPVTSAH